MGVRGFFVNQRWALVVTVMMFASTLSASAQDDQPGQPSLFPTAEVDCPVETLTLTDRSVQAIACTITNPNAYSVEVAITHTVDGSTSGAEEFGITADENITLEANEEVDPTDSDSEPQEQIEQKKGSNVKDPVSIESTPK